MSCDIINWISVKAGWIKSNFPENYYVYVHIWNCRDYSMSASNNFLIILFEIWSVNR